MLELLAIVEVLGGRRSEQRPQQHPDVPVECGEPEEQQVRLCEGLLYEYGEHRPVVGRRGIAVLEPDGGVRLTTPGGSHEVVEVVVLGDDQRLRRAEHAEHVEDEWFLRCRFVVRIDGERVDGPRQLGCVE